MSRSTRAARHAPLHPFRPFDPATLAAALLLTPLALSCGASDDAGGSSKVSGPLAPEDDPIVRVVPLDDGTSDASVRDASASSAPDASPDEDPIFDGAVARDAAVEPAPTSDEAEQPAPSAGPATSGTRDAGAPRADAATTTACLPEAASGGGTALPSTPTVVSTAAGTVQVAVRASGTGCPPCTSRTTLAADGQTFTTLFSAFDVALGGADTTTRACEIAITLRSASGHEYAVTELSYQGHAELASGQTARQATRHGFDAAPSGSAEPETQLAGPRMGAYMFRAPATAEDLVWSACGPERELTVSVSASVSDAMRRPGLLSLSTTSARSGAKLELKLDARECEP